MVSLQVRERSAGSTRPGTSSSAAPARTPAEVPAPVGVLALSLTEPLPGFPAHRDYVLVPAEDGGRLFWLQSVAPDGPRFLAVPAAAYFPDYAPTVPGAACRELGVADPREARLFCLVTVPDGDAAAATANLRAPVVVNPATHQARQVVLPDSVHPIRRSLRR
ncbi:flagellar assembly protein FliW [Blastococcus mobilis]|uniref:Flagellar assembly factor FliW n=1 Tax=Blastococcus mobilis TaxID=1938746 RepID=A0A238W7F7_9ACTN|nr:flagellar assembly protein FliW [Blastococcus mobilis]SNR42525.1 flagellar assembly factor FliW [Blastococcus mobilis]